MTAGSTPRARTSDRIDPRIRRRRVAVSREQGRRRLRWLLVLVVVLVLAAAAFGVTRSALLAVRTVEVTGPGQTSPEAVRAASGIDAGDPILYADLGRAAARIEALPWVQTASVRRDLPGTITIEITERTPVAWWAAPDGSVVLVDGSGRVLAQVPEAPPELPGLEGLDPVGASPGTTVSPAALAGVLDELPEALRTRVVRVVRTDESGSPGAVLALASGPEVRLGTLAEIPAKGSAALAVLGVLGDGEASYLDVREPSAPVTG